MNENANALVTGASGFLGKRIARRLCLMSKKAILLDRGFKRLSADIASSTCRTFVADITTSTNLAEPFNDVEAVVHAAGLAHVFDRSGAMDEAFWRVNADGTENVARAAAKAGVKHFVLISSSSVYGPHHGTVDEASPCRPVGAYAESKLEAETRARRIATEAGMALTILRPVTMFGEGDPGNVKRLIRSVDRHRFLWIGNGANRKSLLHRDDVAEACVRALQRKPEGELVLNVAGPAYEMREIISTIAQGLRRAVPPFHIPTGPVVAAASLLGRLGHSPAGGRNGLVDSLRKWMQDDVYDGTRIHQLLQWQPRVSLQEGLQREIEWYLKSQKGRQR